MSSPVPAQVHHILTPQDHTIWGAKLREAGLDQQQILQLMAQIENEAKAAAEAAGRRVAMATADMFLDMLRNVHDQTADRILNRLQARNSGRVMNAIHQDCVNVAATERYGVHQPPIIQQQ